MGYYIRYFVRSEPPDLRSLNAGIPEIKFSNRQASNDRPSADLAHDGEICAELEINVPGDGLFEEEIAEQKEFASNGKGDRQTVIDFLDACKGTIAVRVLKRGNLFRDTLDKIDPLWQWLDEHHNGLLQFDSDGYYVNEAKILEEA